MLPVLRPGCVAVRPSHCNYSILQVPALGEPNNFCKHNSIELVCPRKHEEDTLTKYIREGTVWFKRKLSKYLSNSEDVI